MKKVNHNCRFIFFTMVVQFSWINIGQFNQAVADEYTIFQQYS